MRSPFHSSTRLLCQLCLYMSHVIGRSLFKTANFSIPLENIQTTSMRITLPPNPPPCDSRIIQKEKETKLGNCFWLSSSNDPFALEKSKKWTVEFPKFQNKLHVYICAYTVRFASRKKMWPFIILSRFQFIAPTFYANLTRIPLHATPHWYHVFRKIIPKKFSALQ
jgi:hypothetical protein